MWRLTLPVFGIFVVIMDINGQLPTKPFCDYCNNNDPQVLCMRGNTCVPYHICNGSCVHGALCEICQHFQGEICTAPQNLLAALERQGENTTKLREDCPGSG